MSPTKFILVPMGSAGDVHPFIYLGKILQARGHDVLMIAQEIVREMPEKAGILTRAWGDAAEQEKVIRNPDLWHPNKAFHLIAGLLPQIAADTIPMIREEVEEGRTVLIGGALSFGARIVAEKWNVPLLTTHLQPSIFMSVEKPPIIMAKMEWLPKLPRFLRQAFFALGNWRVDKLLGPGIDKVRASVGLTGRTHGVMRHYWHAPDGVLCLFPDFFAAKAADWPEQAVLTRFPLYDESTERPIDPVLEAFLAADPTPPVIITPGSANAHGREFIQQAVAACALMNRRALVVTRYPDQVGPLPKGSASFEYIPFGRVFPRGAAVIHHGGIGTTAECLLAGIPQLIMPMAHDQPDNAARLTKMGVADYLYPGKFKVPAIARMLESLIHSPAVKSACVVYQQKMREQMTGQQVADLIEKLSTRALSLRKTNNAGVLV